MPDPGKHLPFSRTEKSIITDFHKSLGENMLQETSDEFLGP
jgi:hypothetical protein